MIQCTDCAPAAKRPRSLGNGWYECRICWRIWRIVGHEGMLPEEEPTKGWNSYDSLKGHPRPIAPKQVWTHPCGWEVRVMGVVEKHVAYRRKGSAPGIAHINEFRKQFTYVRAK